MAAIPQSHAARGQGVGAARAPIPALKTVRPKLFRRASLTSWGKDNLNMTRAAAEVNLTELMLTVQQQKVCGGFTAIDMFMSGPVDATRT